MSPYGGKGGGNNSNNTANTTFQQQSGQNNINMSGGTSMSGGGGPQQARGNNKPGTPGGGGKNINQTNESSSTKPNNQGGPTKLINSMNFEPTVTPGFTNSSSGNARKSETKFEQNKLGNKDYKKEDVSGGAKIDELKKFAKSLPNRVPKTGQEASSTKEGTKASRGGQMKGHHPLSRPYESIAPGDGKVKPEFNVERPFKYILTDFMEHIVAADKKLKEGGGDDEPEAGTKSSTKSCCEVQQWTDPSNDKLPEKKDP